MHRILFTGHMLDAGNRPQPRFPARKENVARQEIRKYLLREKKTAKEELTGIASGACGGDILFHEQCAEMDIPTEMYLALPVEAFKKESVSFAGVDWDIRFDKLISKLPVRILPGTDVSDQNKNVWGRTNLWMLNVALENGGENMSLIALWDGKGGDGEGGTEHMVKMVKELGAEINIIDITKI